jgi:hypothetical protein
MTIDSLIDDNYISPRRQLRIPTRLFHCSDSFLALLGGHIGVNDNYISPLDSVPNDNYKSPLDRSSSASFLTTTRYCVSRIEATLHCVMLDVIELPVAGPAWPAPSDSSGR